MNRVLAGAAAGTLAAVPMTAYWEYMHTHMSGEPPRPLPPREIVEAIAVRAGVSRQLSERDVENLTLAAHFGYAALTGALFGLLTPQRGVRGMTTGMLFGLGVWAASYLGWLPAAGLRQPITYDPPARTRLMIGGHLVWGAVTGLITSANGVRTTRTRRGAGTRRPPQASTPNRARA